MNTGFAAEIDWSRPWLAPYAAMGQRVLQAADWRAALNAEAEACGLCNHRRLPIRFVPQESLPAGTAYEAFISATGGVPTRNNLHDFFNALVWLTFPEVKVRLNALQAEAIARTSESPSAVRIPHRGSLRDAATIFDENAALLAVRDIEVLDALRMHRWSDVFIDQREAFKHGCEVWLFGHALMEKLVRPYKAITAHTWPLVVDDEFFELGEANRRVFLSAAIDRQLANSLTTSDFTPLPVLGVPGWWEGQDLKFYADVSVFRPKRQKEQGNR